VLLLSSGAVYGQQDPSQSLTPEETPCRLDPTADKSAYGEGKRASEWLLANAARALGAQLGIARCYAMIGPGLPGDGPFAAGNFLRDALQSEEIHIQSDGTSRRSYLYMTDVMIWLLAILVRGSSERPYNVGSELPVSIRQLAELVVATSGRPLAIRQDRAAVEGTLPERYVPSTSRIRADLGVSVTVGLDEGLRRHWNWLMGGI
jgi:dTDP-glucose 4,6-dehydratase